MDLEFSEDQDELRRSVRTFLERECPPTVARRVAETGEPDSKLWESMVALDWPALSIPTEYGGMGFGFSDVAVLCEELGYAMAPGPYLATVTQFAVAVREAGTAEQRAKFLGAVASGAATGALAFADHPRRWRVSDIQVGATRKGERWELSGRKHGVLVESDVTEVVVAAHVPDGAMGLFVVPGADLAISPLRALDATRSLATIDLDGVLVACERALGEPGTDNTLALERTRQEAAVALALESVGICQRMLDLVIQYAKDRHQFGVPIGSFQAVKHKLTDLYLVLERARSLTYFAVAAIAEDDDRRASAVAMAKAAADDAQKLVCRDTFQTLGGIGFTWEHDAHLFIKRATSTGALFGSATEHRIDLARILGVARSA